MLITVNIVNTSQKVAFRYKNILQIFACFVLGWTVCFPLKNVRSHWKLWDFYQMIWFKNQTKPNFRAGKRFLSVYIQELSESPSPLRTGIFFSFFLSLFYFQKETDWRCHHAVKHSWTGLPLCSPLHTAQHSLNPPMLYVPPAPGISLQLIRPLFFLTSTRPITGSWIFLH